MAVVAIAHHYFNLSRLSALKEVKRHLSLRIVTDGLTVMAISHTNHNHNSKPQKKAFDVPTS
jgi:hypothetical protein